MSDFESRRAGRAAGRRRRCPRRPGLAEGARRRARARRRAVLVVARPRWPRRSPYRPRCRPAVPEADGAGRPRPVTARCSVVHDEPPSRRRTGGSRPGGTWRCGCRIAGGTADLSTWCVDAAMTPADAGRGAAGRRRASSIDCGEPQYGYGAAVLRPSAASTTRPTRAGHVPAIDATPPDRDAREHVRRRPWLGYRYDDATTLIHVVGAPTRDGGSAIVDSVRTGVEASTATAAATDALSDAGSQSGDVHGCLPLRAGRLARAERAAVAGGRPRQPLAALAAAPSTTGPRPLSGHRATGTRRR